MTISRYEKKQSTFVISGTIFIIVGVALVGMGIAIATLSPEPAVLLVIGGVVAAAIGVELLSVAGGGRESQ